MKPGQNPLIAYTDLEEMAAQLAQQEFSMASNQALMQFLSILPKSEYEIEKRTFRNGLQPNQSVRGMGTFNVNGRRAEHVRTLLRPARGLGETRILRLVPVVVRRNEGVAGGEGTKSKRKRRMNSTRSHLATMLAAGKPAVRRETA